MSGSCIQKILTAIAPLGPTHVHMAIIVSAVSELETDHEQQIHELRQSLVDTVNCNVELEEKLAKTEWLLENAKNRRKSKKRPRLNKHGYLKYPEKYDNEEIHNVMADVDDLSDDAHYNLAKRMNKA